MPGDRITKKWAKPDMFLSSWNLHVGNVEVATCPAMRETCEVFWRLILSVVDIGSSKKIPRGRNTELRAQTWVAISQEKKGEWSRQRAVRGRKEWDEQNPVWVEERVRSNWVESVVEGEEGENETAWSLGSMLYQVGFSTETEKIVYMCAIIIKTI